MTVAEVALRRIVEHEHEHALGLGLLKGDEGEALAVRRPGRQSLKAAVEGQLPARVVVRARQPQLLDTVEGGDQHQLRGAEGRDPLFAAACGGTTQRARQQQRHSWYPTP